MPGSISVNTWCLSLRNLGAWVCIVWRVSLKKTKALELQLNLYSLAVVSFSPWSGQNCTLRQLGVCEPATRRGLAFCAEMGLPYRGYSLSAGSDADTENEAVMSPEHAMRLWGRGAKSGRSSCLSSRSNSALTLTDTEHENKSDSENGESPSGFVMAAFRASVLMDGGGLFFSLSSFLLACLLFLPSAFSFVFKAVELEKWPWRMLFFFFPGRKVNIRNEVVQLRKGSMMCSLSFLNNSLIVYRRKKRLALTYLGPCHLLSSVGPQSKRR